MSSLQKRNSKVLGTAKQKLKKKRLWNYRTWLTFIPTEKARLIHYIEKYVAYPALLHTC